MSDFKIPDKIQIPKIGKHVAKEAEVTEDGKVEVGDGLGDQGFDTEFKPAQFPTMSANDIVGVEPMTDLPTPGLDRLAFVRARNTPLPDVQPEPHRVPKDMVQDLLDMDEILKTGDDDGD